MEHSSLPSRCVGYLGGVGLITIAIVLGSSPLHFINAPALLIVFTGALLFTAAAHGFESLFAALNAGVGSLTENNKASAHSHALVLLTLRNTFLGAGAVGALIGTVQMLSVMDDTAKIGPSMAVTILSLFYGFFLADLLVGPLANRLLAHSAAHTNPSQQSQV